MLHRGRILRWVKLMARFVCQSGVDLCAHRAHLQSHPGCGFATLETSFFRAFAPALGAHSMIIRSLSRYGEVCVEELQTFLQGGDRQSQCGRGDRTLVLAGVL